MVYVLDMLLIQCHALHRPSVNTKLNNQENKIKVTMKIGAKTPRTKDAVLKRGLEDGFRILMFDYLCDQES